ncbi:oxidoreductase family protein [Metabacillus halosaccharovorans]|uniref:oxidoreductase family protein n=1 Tax=Metabacillus halosaccharovorans TaxID=930124 RepID=UPI001C1F9993|nr:oxidoreductase family protein [Metabacillus halosaccharovorans]
MKYLSAPEITACHETPVSKIYYINNNSSNNLLPSNLFLKTTKENAFSDFQKKLALKEVEFYKNIVKNHNDLPIPNCYGAQLNNEGNYYILLEDYSSDYKMGEWSIPPYINQCKKAISSIAKFHASFWESKILLSSEEFLIKENIQNSFSTCLDSFRGSYIDKKQIPNERIVCINQMFLAFSDYLGDRLSNKRKNIYMKVISQLDRFLTLEDKKVTLIHGDSHFWNYLYPTKDYKEAIIVDWQTWDINVGTEDLSHMMALHWFPERRQLLEKDLLNFYLQCLKDYGVKNYNWNNLIIDYKTSIIRKLFLPIFQWSSGLILPNVWWTHLERVFMAFEDLNCQELIE